MLELSPVDNGTPLQDCTDYHKEMALRCLMLLHYQHIASTSNANEESTGTTTHVLLEYEEGMSEDLPPKKNWWKIISLLSVRLPVLWYLTLSQGPQ